MSAFLGPIHTWLYNKIKFQEELSTRILEAVYDGEEKQQLEVELQARCGSLEAGALKDLVDPNNIHGWLQQRVNIVEKRLAYLVTTMKAQDEKLYSTALNVAWELGDEKAQRFLEETTEDSVSAVYQAMENLLLDGMPCDRVNEIQEVSQEELLVRRTTEIHGPYWEQVKGNVSDYYEIRNAFLKGFLAKTGITLEPIDQTQYRLIRR